MIFYFSFFIFHSMRLRSYDMWFVSQQYIICLVCFVLESVLIISNIGSYTHTKFTICARGREICEFVFQQYIIWLVCFVLERSLIISKIDSYTHKIYSMRLRLYDMWFVFQQYIICLVCFVLERSLKIISIIDTYTQNGIMIIL